MKLEVLQENLTKALNLSLRFVNSRIQLPILSNVLLRAKKTNLEVQATNLELSISISVGAKVEEEGELTVPARTIADLISNLSSGTVKLIGEKEQLKIVSDGFSGTVSGINSTDFPKIPQNIGKEVIELPKEDFEKALSQVVFSASIDETRPILTGVLFLFEKQYLTLVATDGFRLSQKRIFLKPQVNQSQVNLSRLILPKGVLSELLRISGNLGDSLLMQIRDSDNQVVFGFNDNVLSSRIIEGEFPNFEKIIPKTSITKIYIDKEEFLRGVKLASVFARESTNLVKIAVKKNVLSLIAESSKSGSEKTDIAARVEGEEMEIAYNYRFIEEFINAISGNEIQIEFSSSSAPGIFRDPKESDFLHLIMPVRTQS